MKLDYLKLQNFRQYYSEQRIRFARDRQRNVTIIHGVNGAGKTSLFIALNWCLYGQGTENIGELISKRAMTEADVGTSVETTVELGFTHDGERYIASRTLRCIRSLQQWQPGGADEFALWQIRHDGQTKKVNNSTGVIESFLPSNVRTYFFFDGEKIDNFAKPGHEKEVESAVRNVLKIEVIERAKDHLKAVAKDYQIDLKKQTPPGRLQDLLDQQEKKEIELNKLSAHRKKQHEELEAAKTQMESIDLRLAEIESARVLVENRKSIENSLKSKEHEKDRLWSEIRGVANQGFISLAKPVFDKATTLLNQKRERGEIPSGIREQFLNDLLSQMRCICGRSIYEGSEEHQRIVDLLNRSIPSGLEDVVLQTAGDLRVLTSEIEKIPGRLRDFMARKAGIDEEMEALEGQLDEISRQLESFDLEEVGDLEKKRLDYQAQIQELSMQIGRAEGKIEQITKDLKQLQSEVEKERTSEKKAKRLQSYYILASKSAEVAREMFELFAHDMRETIQTEVRNIFKRLVWKESHFQDIRLSEDYQLNVIDRYGLPARPEMSAGERQVLSLAFIAGMAKVAKDEETFPLVMDTPFGRLSSTHREKITEHLPEIADQLILFVTDEELHGQARTNLEPRIGEEYKLVFDLATSCTEIQEVKR